jgi:hypothetical protein
VVEFALMLTQMTSGASGYFAAGGWTRIAGCYAPVQARLSLGNVVEAETVPQAVGAFKELGTSI